MKNAVQDGKESEEEYRRHVRVTQNAGQGKAGQDRAEQDRTGQSKGKQNKAKRDLPETYKPIRTM